MLLSELKILRYQLPDNIIESARVKWLPTGNQGKSQKEEVECSEMAQKAPAKVLLIKSVCSSDDSIILLPFYLILLTSAEGRLHSFARGGASCDLDKAVHYEKKLPHRWPCSHRGNCKEQLSRYLFQSKGADSSGLGGRLNLVPLGTSKNSTNVLSASPAFPGSIASSSKDKLVPGLSNLRRKLQSEIPAGK